MSPREPGPTSHAAHTDAHPDAAHPDAAHPDAAHTDAAHADAGRASEHPPGPHPQTRTVHHRVPALSGSRPTSTPIYQGHVFAFDDAEDLAAAFDGAGGPFLYGRLGNPTVQAFADAVTDLEGGAAGLAFSSGMGAINAVLLSTLSSGDHVVAQRCVYGGTYALLADLAERWGVEVTYLESDDPVELRAALRPTTRLLYLETIANPTTGVVDLPALAGVAREHGVTTVVDNTFASPLLCRPLEHGADIVLHSATKYLGGHADVVGGVAVFRTAEARGSVWRLAVEQGATADPFAAWLTLRGMRTLALRMTRHCDNALDLAGRLADHPAVARVRYPMLPGHPDHAVARRLLTGGGGVLSFDLAGGRPAGRAFVGALRLVSLSPSLGDVTTLVMHPASTSHRQLGPEALAAAGIGEGTVRLSVGIEHPDDLWADLRQALDRLRDPDGPPDEDATVAGGAVAGGAVAGG